MMQIVILIEFLWKKVSVEDTKFLAIDDCLSDSLVGLTTIKNQLEMHVAIFN